MSKSGKNDGFKTPEGYFEEVDGKIWDRLKQKSSAIPEQEGFGLPEGYFEDLNDKILQRLDRDVVKVIPLKSYKRYYYAAASVAAIVLLALGLNWDSSDNIGFEDLANTEIETYFEDNELGLSTYEIAEVLPIDELEVNDMLDSRFNEENMLDYLNENLDDIEELNLEEDE